MTQEKKWYFVSLSAEDFTDGYVRLTADEALLVDRATNPRNWKKVQSRPWSGIFCIDIEHPLDELPK